MDSEARAWLGRVGLVLERQSLGRPRRLVHWLERPGRGLEPGLGRLRRVMAQERLRATDGATSLAFARRLFRGGVSAAGTEPSPHVTEPSHGVREKRRRRQTGLWLAGNLAVHHHKAMSDTGF